MCNKFLGNWLNSPSPRAGIEAPVLSVNSVSDTLIEPVMFCEERRAIAHPADARDLEAFELHGSFSHRSFARRCARLNIVPSESCSIKSNGQSRQGLILTVFGRPCYSEGGIRQYSQLLYRVQLLDHSCE
jgi:hypothetical protein